MCAVDPNKLSRLEISFKLLEWPEGGEIGIQFLDDLFHIFLVDEISHKNVDWLLILINPLMRIIFIPAFNNPSNS